MNTSRKYIATLLAILLCYCLSEKYAKAETSKDEPLTASLTGSHPQVTELNELLTLRIANNGDHNIVVYVPREQDIKSRMPLPDGWSAKAPTKPEDKIQTAIERGLSLAPGKDFATSIPFNALFEKVKNGSVHLSLTVAVYTVNDGRSFILPIDSSLDVQIPIEKLGLEAPAEKRRGKINSVGNLPQSIPSEVRGEGALQEANQKVNPNQPIAKSQKSGILVLLILLGTAALSGVWLLMRKKT